jgi:hypothetical protein
MEGCASMKVTNKNYDIGAGIGNAAAAAQYPVSNPEIGFHPAAPIDWAAVAAAFAPGQAPQTAGPASDSNADLKSFLDSQYATNAANMKATLGFKQAQLEQDDANDETSFREALRRMDAQHPRDDQAAKESANKAGLFYSGTLGKNLGDIASNYAQRSADATEARQARSNQRSAQKSALASGYDVDIGDLAQSAAERKLSDDTSAADGGYLVRDLGTAAVAPVAKAIVPVAAKVGAAAATPKKKTTVKGLAPLGRLGGSQIGRAAGRMF